MSGCDLPDDPELFKAWQEFQRKNNKQHNEELHRFSEFRRQYHDELRSGLRFSAYFEEHPGCACPYEEVLAAYSEKCGIVVSDGKTKEQFQTEEKLLHTPVKYAVQ